MKVKVEKAGTCRKLLHVEAPAEIVDEAYAATVAVFMKVAQIPGFRPGRAPQALIERRYARDIDGEVRDAVLRETYPQALKESGLDPVAVLNIEVKELKRRAPLSYAVTLDVAPDFKLPKYKGISLKEKPVAVTEDQVTAALESLLDRLARFEAVEGRPVHKGDLVKVDYEGALDGQPVASLGKAVAGLDRGRDFWVMADENAFLPGFDTGLIGKAAGDRVEIASAFPATFRAPALAGKTVLYRVTVKAIREKRRPPLDADFLKQAGAESEAALRAQIRESLKQEARLNEKNRLKDEAIAYLLAKTSLDLPETLVQEETRTQFAALVRRNLMRGVPREELDGKRSDLLASAASSAAEKVKIGYILHRIAEEEKLTADEAEINQAVADLAARYRMPVEELRRELEDERKMDSIRHQVRMEKTIDFVLANAKLNEEGFFSRLVGR